MWLYSSVNENVWGYGELLSSCSFIGPPTSLWHWRSPRDGLKGTVNHETEPVSPKLKINCPCLRYVPAHCWGVHRKVALLPALLKLKESARLEPCFSSLCFPSVHLGGRRQTAALRTRWMEVGKGALEKERAGKQEREREWDVWRSTSHRTEWQMRGLWSRATFHSDQS